MSTAVASSEVKTARPGQEWLPSYPEDWHLERMKAVFREIAVKGEPNLPLLAATQRMGVVRKETYGQRTVVAQHGLENLKVVEVDDFVISLRSFEGGIEVAHDRGIISPAYTVLRVQDKAYHGYFRHLLKSRYFLDAIRLSVTGIREGQSINYAKLGCTFLPLPPRGDAALIVRYLDHAELRIANAIAAKRDLAALLSERRATAVQDIALGRLESSLNFYDSEVPWIGRIPETWQVVPSKSLFAHRRERATPGTTVMTASQSRGIVPRDDFMVLEGRRVMAVLTGDDILKQVEPDDFVISMRSFQGGLEWSHVSGAVSSAYVVMTPRAEVVPEYYSHLLKSRAYISALRATSDLVRDGQALRYANFGKVPLPLPPVEDQHRLAHQISTSVAQIDKAIVAVEAEITLLKEYRTGLISDVVTGKIDVREEAAKLPDIDPAELAAVLAGGAAGADEEEVADGDD